MSKNCGGPKRAAAWEEEEIFMRRHLLYIKPCCHGIPT